MTIKFWHLVILLVLVFFVGGGGGFFAGKKWATSPPPIDTHVLDSIILVNKTLEDSLFAARNATTEIIKEKVKYRTLYDTIVKVEGIKEITQGLKAIANTPVQ